MTVKNEKFTIATKGFDDFIDITQKIEGIVASQKIKDGILSVCVIASTASVITLEYEPGLVRDLPEILNLLIPVNKVYEHDNAWHDGNAHAHLKASFLGNSVTLPIIEGKIELGRWQQIVLIDFDNKARVREIAVSISY